MNRAPLIVGTLAILALAITLCYRSPSPGALSSAHATTASSLPTCDACHAEGGLDAGCLSCHAEIATQLTQETGYHHELIADGAPECARCHPEHHGATFDVMEAVAWRSEKRDAFRHAHTPFDLSGAHDGLGCDACHKVEFAMPGYADKHRRKTFLGLGQTCLGCHEDVHGSQELHDCTRCHGQTAFKPAVGFDHDKHFPLQGGHAAVECKACHVSSNELSFEKVRGTTCVECHADPHQTDWQRSCASCHEADALSWAAAASSITPALHAQTGFNLVRPHDQQDCEACHGKGFAYPERFQTPARAEDRCDQCHADVHAGQFSERFSACLDCHTKTHFVPSAFDAGRHDRFALQGAHAKAECSACHLEEGGVRRFVGTSSRCADCHKDVHAGEFGNECSTCHGEHSFLPSTFGPAQHATFPLKGAHVTTACGDCHTTDAQGVRRFRDTPRACASCHDDAHAGQFQQACAACHNETAFRPSHFGMRDHTMFPLEGAHDAVACIACHATDPAGVRRFVGTTRECASCHENPHGQQFSAELAQGDCTACHKAGSASFDIRPFDHDATGYALRGKHRAARCNDCHRVPAAGRPRRYRDTPASCSSCHTDEHRGQFGQRDCSTCHESTQAWQLPRFDHGKTRFPLDGQHARVSCSECHTPVRQRDGKRVVQYRPLGTSCKDCHEIRK